jgi:hypothetical protein
MAIVPLNITLEDEADWEAQQQQSWGSGKGPLGDLKYLIRHLV